MIRVLPQNDYLDLRERTEVKGPKDLRTGGVNDLAVFLFVFEEGDEGFKVGFLKLLGEGGFPGKFYGDLNHETKVCQAEEATKRRSCR
jgi:hypothetical protein